MLFRVEQMQEVLHGPKFPPLDSVGASRSTNFRASTTYLILEALFYYRSIMYHPYFPLCSVLLLYWLSMLRE